VGRIVYVECRDGNPSIEEDSGLGFFCETLTVVEGLPDWSDSEWLPYAPAADHDSRIAKLEAENARLTRERDSAERRLHELSNDMWSDVEFQWRKLVDVPEDSLTPGGQAIRRQLIEAARESLGVYALEARLNRKLDRALAQRDDARRLVCYAKTGVDPKLVRRIELIALRRAADATWGPGEGKRLFPERKTDDESPD